MIMVISTYFNFRAKGAFGDFGVRPIVSTKMRHPTPWGPEGMDQTWVPQSWAALDVNPKTIYHIPKMMNICGCMGLLAIPVWDPD